MARAGPPRLRAASSDRPRDRRRRRAPCGRRTRRGTRIVVPPARRKAAQHCVGELCRAPGPDAVLGVRRDVRGDEGPEVGGERLPAAEQKPVVALRPRRRVARIAAADPEHRLAATASPSGSAAISASGSPRGMVRRPKRRPAQQREHDDPGDDSAASTRRPSSGSGSPRDTTCRYRTPARPPPGTPRDRPDRPCPQPCTAAVVAVVELGEFGVEAGAVSPDLLGRLGLGRVEAALRKEVAEHSAGRGERRENRFPDRGAVGDLALHHSAGQRPRRPRCSTSAPDARRSGLRGRDRDRQGGERAENEGEPLHQMSFHVCWARRRLACPPARLAARPGVNYSRFHPRCIAETGPFVPCLASAARGHCNSRGALALSR